MKLLKFASIAVYCSCISPGRVTFELSIINVDPAVDRVRFNNVDVEPTNQTVLVSRLFDTYEDALDVGDQDVIFLSGGSTFQRGTVNAGVCQQCVYAGCPTSSDIDLEKVNYSGSSDVTPLTYGCFTCTGRAGEMEVSCP